MRIVTSRLSVAAAVAFGLATNFEAPAAGTGGLAACASQPLAKGKSRQRFDSTALMTVAGVLESQGEADFHIKFGAPGTECLLETFDVGTVKVRASYSAFEKGESTLLYRFVANEAPNSTEVLVIYSGLAALVANKGPVFHVSQEKDGVISWYAMYREEPTYAATRGLVNDILAGKTQPLLAVRWPKGAKEGEVVAFDSKRLK